MAICEHGCASASACKGACQPLAPVRTGKHCRWCSEGWEIRDGDHWVVTSIRKPTITIRPCVAWAQPTASLTPKDQSHD